MCSDTERWFCVCPIWLPHESASLYPKYSYAVLSAETHHKKRLSASRPGVASTPEEFAQMKEVVTPLDKRKQSVEVIWAEYADEMPVGVRSAYNYQEDGVIDIANLGLHRKMRMRSAGSVLEKDKTALIGGRTYEDFQALPITEQACCAQANSVCGFEYNRRNHLSLRLLVSGFASISERSTVPSDNARAVVHRTCRRTVRVFG